MITEVIYWRVRATLYKNGCLENDTGGHIKINVISSVQYLSCDSLRPHGLQHIRLPCPSPTPSFLKPSNQWWNQTISPSAIPFFSCLQSCLQRPSIGAFSFESVLHIRRPKYWNFSFSPSNEYLGLVSFRIDWLELLAVQGTIKRLLQHHNSKVSIIQCSVFFMVQLTSTHDYWKNHSFDYMDLCW